MGTAASPELASNDGWRTGILLFGLALGFRLLFWQATPDAAWPYSAYYKGDAATWLEWARAIQESRPFEVGLPIRPPGAAYLIAALWIGESAGVAGLKLIWCWMGALAVGLVYAAVLRSFGDAVALHVGLLCAGSTGLMLLTTSLNNETPYLLLVAGTLVLWEPLRRPRPRAATLVVWSAAHALACLLRIEHLLFFALVTPWLAASWALAGSDRSAWRAISAWLALSLVCFAAVLAPWHAKAWADVRRFNTEPLPTDAVTEAALREVEQAVAHIRWEDGALSRLEELPAAVRRNAAGFIAATVFVRGGQIVAGDPLLILDEAFGSRPRPLRERPFVSLYGGLAFYLANNPAATGGFDRTPLDRPPPLVGGADRFPLVLVRGLPPPQLTLTYPPHLELLNDGYRLAGRWIRSHPGSLGELAFEKLRRFWRGAALGLGGYNLPLGLSGARRSVDLVVPEGGVGPAVWRGGVLVLALLGLWTGRRRAALVPWLAFLLSKLAITVAFFGYARQGALVVPVVALLICLALGRLFSSAVRRSSGAAPSPRRRRWVVVAALLLLAVEAGRWLSRPEVALDGRPVGAGDPFPTHEHRDRRLEIR